MSYYKQPQNDYTKLFQYLLEYSSIGRRGVTPNMEILAGYGC